MKSTSIWIDLNVGDYRVSETGVVTKRVEFSESVHISDFSSRVSMDLSKNRQELHRLLDLAVDGILSSQTQQKCFELNKVSVHEDTAKYYSEG